jgi:hypothetical protein
MPELNPDGYIMGSESPVLLAEVNGEKSEQEKTPEAIILEDLRKLNKLVELNQKPDPEILQLLADIQLCQAITDYFKTEIYNIITGAFVEGIWRRDFYPFGADTVTLIFDPEGIGVFPDLTDDGKALLSSDMWRLEACRNLSEDRTELALFNRIYPAIPIKSIVGVKKEE